MGEKEHPRSTGRSGTWQSCTAASKAPAVPAGGLQPLSIKSRHYHSSCSKQTLCHSHPLHLSPPHRERTHSLRTITGGFLCAQLKKGRLVTVEWFLRTCENPCSPLLKVAQMAAFSFQFPFLRYTPFPLFIFFKPSCFLYLYLRYMWYEGLILNIYSLRLVCGIYFNLYIIVCF